MGSARHGEEPGGGACDCGMPVAMKIGGVTGRLRAASLAESCNLPLVSHIFPEISAPLVRSPDRLPPRVSRQGRSHTRATPEGRRRAHPRTGRPGHRLDWDEDSAERFCSEERRRLTDPPDCFRLRAEVRLLRTPRPFFSYGLCRQPTPRAVAAKQVIHVASRYPDAGLLPGRLDDAYGQYENVDARSRWRSSRLPGIMTHYFGCLARRSNLTADKVTSSRAHGRRAGPG